MCTVHAAPTFQPSLCELAANSIYTTKGTKGTRHYANWQPTVSTPPREPREPVIMRTGSQQYLHHQGNQGNPSLCELAANSIYTTKGTKGTRHYANWQPTVSTPPREPREPIITRTGSQQYLHHQGNQGNPSLRELAANSIYTTKGTKGTIHDMIHYSSIRVIVHTQHIS